MTAQEILWGWSHSFKSYLLMFDLNDADLDENILDVASGASTFNVEMQRRGFNVVSCDPLYATSTELMPAKINKMLQNLENKVYAQQDKFEWRYVRNAEELMNRQRAMATIFLEDYAAGLKEKRYLNQSLPTLDFSNYQFDLVLCGNFLFDGPNQDQNFQLASIKEMCRVAKEARIFPLLDDQGEISSHLGPIMSILQAEGYGVEVRQVAYHLQKNGNAMLRVWPKECQL